MEKLEETDLLSESVLHFTENIDYGASKNIVYRILNDLRNRKGLSKEWDRIDFDIQEEILSNWLYIANKELNINKK